jgi:hypothetical protein
MTDHIQQDRAAVGIEVQVAGVHQFAPGRTVIG